MKLLLLASFALSLVLQFSPYTAAAQSSCHSFFQEHSIYKEDSSAQSIANWAQLKANTHVNMAKNLNEAERENLEALLEARLFYDYVHLFPHLYDYFSGKKELKDLDVYKLYGDQWKRQEGNIVANTPWLLGIENKLRSAFGIKELKGKPPVLQGAFANSVATAQMVSHYEGPADILFLKSIHRQMMKGNIENIKTKDIGEFRETQVIGNAFGDLGAVTDLQLAIIKGNVYLDFSEKYRTADGKHSGQIIYPTVHHQTGALQVIQASHPEVYEKVLSYYRKSGKEKDRVNDRELLDLEKSFIAALTEERFARFSAEVASLGEVKIGVNHLPYIEAVARFQRDLISIHPFANGNGRSTRVLMNYLLQKVGLPPVQLVDANLDIQSTAGDWEKALKRGVQGTYDLYRDLNVRLSQGLSLKNSPHWLFPHLATSVSVDLKKEGSVKVQKSSRQAEVDKQQFVPFFQAWLRQQSDHEAQVKNDTLKTMSDVAKLFAEFQSRKIVDYIHSKDGKRELKQSLVDEDFIETFGEVQSHSPELWQEKRRRWYVDQLLWRGLSNRTHEYSTEELLEHFRSFSSHMSSNRVAKTAKAQSDFYKESVKDFYKYNQDLISGDYVKMAVDHSTTGPMYGNSYGLSTSKNEKVGRAFAMGAMVIAEYGKHADPELQAQLKSRINIAVLRGIKDIDLGRVKVFNPEFSYEYGRQQEVMVIGASDPDSVMLVQKIDAMGEVSTTLVRDLERPYLIHEVSGRYVYSEGALTDDRILKTFDLRN